MNKYLLILSILASTNGFAEINKWVDSENRVHYSDRPPPADAKVSTPAKSKTPDSLTNSTGDNPEDKTDAVPSSAPAASKTIAEREAELKKAQKAKLEAAEKAAKKKADDDVIKANCKGAQDNLRVLDTGIRMVEIDAKGEQSYIDDAQRQQRIDKAKKDISTYCK